MKRTSKYFDLRYVVECKSNGIFFETIAAFNHDEIAKAYAAECRQVNKSYHYRVLERHTTKFRTIFTTEK